ncbi:uncharacterized protein LOC116175625 [Photinus pyralis]|uniref:uncharacterized protein LOC116161033 n=1 Tax=Photinus pyralis TaxID=7054 RepID=UPI001266EB91|nr:uncharacterized protein LOC116161033 [Photinus pyralis]XP_031349704.1 uncharacterized protein LOC116175625 [Photinus pyralis]
MVDAYVGLLKEIDPISIKEETFFDVIGIYFKVKNVHAEGFSNISHSISYNLSYPLSTFNVNMSLPRTFGAVELWDTTLPLIYGNGSLSFDIKNVQFMMQIGFNMTSMLFEPVVFKPSIENAQFAITGVNHNEQYSQELSNKVNHALNVVVNDPEMHASVAAEISAFLNGQYRSFPPKKCWWCPS